MDGSSHSHSPRDSAESSTSAVDLSGTSVGLASSPNSPSLMASGSRNSFARRRASWGRVDVGIGQDPLRVDMSTEPRPQNSNAGWRIDDDPFASSVDDAAVHGMMYRDSPPGFTTTTGFPTAQAGPSSFSLIEHRESGEDTEGSRDDDETRLTTNMSRQGLSREWSSTQTEDSDPELSGAVPHSRRKTLRYNTTPSPLKRTGNTLKVMSEGLRRASVRVVNLAGFGLEEHMRLADVEDEQPDTTLVGKEGDEVEEEELPDLSRSLPIRGRTLGCLGPTSSVRMAMYRLLVYRWTEPLILLLIVFNAVVLTIQSHISAALASDGSQNPPRIKGYFHTWEDYTLFALFCFFTVEMFARISVSGFLLDPEVPVSTILSSVSFSPYPDPSMPAAQSETPAPPSLSRQPSLVHLHPHAQLSSSSRLSFTQRLRFLLANLARPFSLSHNSIYVPHDSPRLATAAQTQSDSTQNKTPVSAQVIARAQEMHAHLRNPSKPNFFSTALRSDNPDVLALPFRLSAATARVQTQRNIPYLRHSWNRIDFIAVVGFWISFVLATAGVERGTYHIGIFRALSVLRTARLLTITSGTTAIMRSLKVARPLLASVAYFVIYATVLFSIIGVQTFNGSYLRSCNLLPVLGESQTDLSQNCGAWIDAETLTVMPYIKQDGSYGSVKGFICPIGQICVENSMNPYSNIESFDTIYYSALQIFIVATANGWSPIMFNMMQAEFFVSCLFFIVCIVVLNFWLINLFVAVITNTFAAIRTSTQKSAFGAASAAPTVDESDEGWTVVDGRRVSTRNRIKDIYESIRWCWVALALFSLVLQATRTVDIGTTHEEILTTAELILTIAFDVEIGIRVLAHLPDWRGFFYRGQNLLDLTLAIGSTIIQIPVIHHSGIYPWLTVFQLMRFYRVILEIPRMRPLLLSVFGNMYGLANMTLFLFILNFIAALVGVQLMRGDIERGDFIDYGQVYNSFLAAYQLFSSENWTNVLYGVGPPEIILRQAPIVILYLTGWFSLANFIVMQMFIAVINENFQVAEEFKRSRQASHYWASRRPQQARLPWLRKLNPYRWFKAQPQAIATEHLPSNLVLPMQKTIVENLSYRRGDLAGDEPSNKATSMAKTHLRRLQRLFMGESDLEPVPLVTIRHTRRDSTLPQDPKDEEIERHLEVLAALNSEAAAVEDLADLMYERRARKADFIRDHPTYDKTFWLFSQDNDLRQLCQKLVVPAGGERIFGVRHSTVAYPMFQLILLIAVIGGIIVEAIANPIYRRDYYQEHGYITGSWFTIAETAFGLTLVVEFLIKVLADGFMFTPNAYIRSIWNILDFLIMSGVLVNVVAGLIWVSGLSRITSSLKALRALRLITLINQMRYTFESLIISGFARILDACLLAILYMIPYAVWGLNIFAGYMKECNDTSVSNVTTCVDEYSNTIYNNSFGFLVPRAWADPNPSTTFSFDSFRDSLLILFEIVSLEGWVDVMTAAVSLVGIGQQPQMNATQFNSIFFIIYNLLGGVIILTLFVSIIIGNFLSKTGTALLTQPQREWIDLQKLIKRQRPSKRPRSRPTWPVRAWCYDRAVRKHGWWHQAMTTILTLHVLALMTQTYGTTSTYDQVRNYFFLIVTAIYAVDTIVRLYGLGWFSFCANGWNLFDIVVSSGSVFTTFIVQVHENGYVEEQLQKLFITCIAFKLVQRTDSLNKFFKTAVASLPVILNLFGLWFIFFFFFAIAYMEVFSMTKWYSAENAVENYTSMGKALVMLAFMTTGEGWNQYMHDYFIEYPRCTILPTGDTDCGSEAWSLTLFIAWNVLSMYIITNLFVGLVVESFYYVFQMSGGSKAITRGEMRAFKKVWAEFANPKTGYLERDRFVPFFGKLSGIFEVKIYPTEYSFPNILARSKDDTPSDAAWPSRVMDGVNLDKLNITLNGIDRAVIKRRKHLYNCLYHEARISYERDKGISFTNMLMLLAHHKLIVDREALVLKDLVIRTETNKLVTDLVDFDRVQSLLLMILYRRRYRAQRDQARQERMAKQDIPAIVVDTDDLLATPPISTHDITSPGRDSTSIPRLGEPVSPLSRPDDNRLSFDISLSPDSPSISPLQRRRRISDISLLSLDDGTHQSLNTSLRDSRLSSEEPDNILSVMQGSPWNDMMLEAEEEEL